jgi:hypothetical protein
MLSFTLRRGKSARGETRRDARQINALEMVFTVSGCRDAWQRPGRQRYCKMQASVMRDCECLWVEYAPREIRCCFAALCTDNPVVQRLVPLLHHKRVGTYGLNRRVGYRYHTGCGSRLWFVTLVGDWRPHLYLL